MSINEVFQIFNNRELATALWVAFFLVFCVIKSNIRESLVKVFQVAGNEKLVVWFILMTAYVTLFVYSMKKISFWDIHLLKDTMFWFLFSAIYMAGQLGDTINTDKEFKKIILENFKVMILVQYFVGLYTFSFLTEFILLPTISLLVGLKVVSEKEEKTQAVGKFMGGLLSLLGLALIIFTCLKMMNNTNTLNAVVSVESFILPFLLTISFIPFLFLQSLYMIYENLFLRLELNNSKNNYFLDSSKIILIRFLGANLGRLKLFHRKYAVRLMQISDFDDLYNLLGEFSRVYK